MRNAYQRSCFGGSSVVNKETFIECGGFDENMFVGFEDVDFSITLFRKGYKIGCCGVLGLVHDHNISNDSNDIEYERKRFSNEKIYASAKYFKKKHGFTVWSEETEEWLKQRERELGIFKKKDEPSKFEEKTIKSIKPKIALIVDQRNWAFDNIAKNLEKNLCNYFDFKIIYMTDIPDQNIVHLVYACLDCDVIHFLWRGFIGFFESKFTEYYLNYYGNGLSEFKSRYIDNLYITASVYDHKYLDQEIATTDTIMKYIKSFTVSSRKLFDIYNELGYNKYFVEITDGVDTALFCPTKMDRFNNIKNRKVIVGWVGNSNWSNGFKEDPKGINTIIKPAVEQLQNEGLNIELRCTDKNEKFIKHSDMPEYYSEIDIYVCASQNEGTPNPILEAMACGIPVISTDVGIVREVFGEKQKSYIMEERSVECLKNKIKEMIANMDNVHDLIEENLKCIQDWTWNKKAMDFKTFFDYCLKEKNNGGMQLEE